MTVKELYDLLDKMIPRALSADWDNDGLACLKRGFERLSKFHGGFC